MSNYTKTTNFATKDALASGNPAKIVKGTEIDTEFNNIAVASGTKADKASPVFTGTVTLPATNADSLSIGGDGVTVTGIKDEDDMASNSATKLASQQSIKAYVDSQVTAQDLDVTDGTNTIAIDLDSEALSLLGGTGVTSTASGNGVTMAIDATVATLSGSQTLTNKTLAAPAVTGALTTNSTIDGRDVAVDGTKLDTVETNADVTDTVNVTAAGALMDSEVTNLAQVKAFDSADYATAAQGTTADAALPKAGGAMTGAITTNSTFAGRDVATDGTKLDGIESGATADQTAAEIKTAYESNADTNAFTDADESKLDGIEALADVTDAANVTAAGALMDSELTSIASVKALDQGVATTDSPTFAGIDVTGTATMDGLVVENNTADVKGTIKNTLTAGTRTATLDILPQNDGAYGVSIQASGGSGTGTFQFNNKNIMKFDLNNDISFYEDTGTTAKFFWDASAESLGIGTDSPSEKLHVNGTALMFGARMSSNNGSTYWDVKRDISTGHFHIADDSLGNVLTIRQDSGNVGIGTSSPSSALHAKGGSISTPADSSAFLANATARLVVNHGNEYGAYVGYLNSTNDAIGIQSARSSAQTGPLSLNPYGGNVGIGTGSPAQKLHITGSAPFARLESTSTSYNGFNALNDSGNFYFGIDDSGGNFYGSAYARAIYSDGAYPVTFYTNAAERMRIDSSGNVGIGTSSPSANLEISSASNPEISIASTAGATSNFLNFKAISHDQQIQTQLKTIDNNNFTSDLAFLFKATGTGGALTEKMRIDSSGNVGIGSTSASGSRLRLDNGGTSGAPQLMLTATGSGTQTEIRHDTSGNLIFDYWNGGGTRSERMRIDSSGNIQQGSYSDTTIKNFNMRSTKAIFNIAVDGATDAAGTTLSYSWANGGQGPLKFSDATSERMRIDSSGNLLVGTTSGSFGARITAESSTSYLFESRRTGTGNEGHVAFRNANGAVGTIFTNGTTTNYNTSSDQRLKENIADADDAGYKIDAIQVRKYDWKADGSHQDYGMVAQELQAVAPEAVSGDADSEDMMGVDYSKLVPMLIKEIQSLRNRVAQLETGE